MVPLSKLSVPQTRAPVPLAPAMQITAGQRGLLNHLRIAGMACRVAARADLFEACALLTLEGETAKQTFVETLVKCLPGALRKQVMWFAPGAVEMSFDEAWVMRCLSSIDGDDANSLAFLLGSRIQASDRRYIGFLFGRISAQSVQY